MFCGWTAVLIVPAGFRGHFVTMCLNKSSQKLLSRSTLLLVWAFLLSQEKENLIRAKSHQGKVEMGQARVRGEEGGLNFSYVAINREKYNCPIHSSTAIFVDY